MAAGIPGFSLYLSDIRYTLSQTLFSPPPPVAGPFDFDRLEGVVYPV
jgi:hypothetical protein